MPEKLHENVELLFGCMVDYFKKAANGKIALHFKGRTFSQNMRQ